ncbi:branched-chain amino acid aminotransferase [candidate division KSB1 bacterium]
MNVHIEPLSENELKPKYTDESILGFGQIFCDRMFIMEYTPDEGWHNARIKKYEPLCLDPSTMVFHYGQEIFEGLKAYPGAGGNINLFRPERNFQRLNVSARRMCMPEVDEEFNLKVLKQLLALEKDWMPEGDESSMYIRPTMIGVDPELGVKSSKKFLYFIILSPSGPYFKEGYKPVKVYVSTEHVRAVRGGVGESKTGGNYGASLLAGKLAREKGCAQVIWLDAIERKYIEEIGAMNLMFVINGKIITPELSGSILRGITRESVIILAKDLGYEVVERKLSIDELVEAMDKGQLSEAFGVGTAAVVSPIGEIVYKDRSYIVNDRQVGDISKTLFKKLTDLQRGRIEDKFGMIQIVNV